jgi:hypothetical protein
MKWDFQDNDKPELDKQVEMEMQLEAGDGSQVTLHNNSVEEAHKTLGTWKLALHTQTKQYNVLLQQNTKYAQNILSSAVSKWECWTAYYTVYLPRNTFILPTCYFTRKQLDKLQQKVTSATLAKGGFVSTMPREVVFGPQLYGGIAMRVVWGEQLINQVQMVVKHIRCPGDCNIMLRIALTWAQLSTGMGFPLLKYTGLWVPHLECRWLTSMRSGMKAINGGIQCT